MKDQATQHGEVTGVGERAMHWGVMTWIGNFGGCLVGMVPIALPLSIVLTLVTLLTGMWAMVLGIQAKRNPSIHAQDKKLGSFGFWLGAAHIVVVVLGAIGVMWGMSEGIFADLGILPKQD